MFGPGGCGFSSFEVLLFRLSALRELFQLGLWEFATLEGELPLKALGWVHTLRVQRTQEVGTRA